MYYNAVCGIILVVIKMKRIISMMLTIFVLLAVIIPVSAKSTVELKVTDATVYAGEEFELKVFISDNSKLSGAVIDLEYDASKLEYVSAEKGAIIDEDAMISIKNTPNNVRFTYLSPDSAIASEGILFSVKFKALENAEGESSVKITIPSAGDFVSENLEKLPYTVKNSTVKIINNTVVNTESTTESTSVENTDLPSNQDDKSTAENTTDNNQNNNNDGNGDNVKIVIGLVVAGLILIFGAVIYLIISKKKR